MIRFLSEFGGISSRLFASCPDKVSSCSPKCAGKDRFSLKPYANDEEEVLADEADPDAPNQEPQGPGGEERFQGNPIPVQPQIPKTIILHYSPWKAGWDWLILLLVIYVAVMTPYLAAFRHPPATPEALQSRNSSIVVTFLSDKLILVDFLVDITFLVDMLVNFRTTYLSNGELVFTPSKIASNYLRGWFLIDAVSAIPFDLILSVARTHDTMTATGLLKTPRLLRLLRVARRIDQYSEYGASVLLLLMASFTMIAHWLACIFYAIARYERPYLEHPIGWLDILANTTGTTYEADDGPDILRSRYITSLYFTFTILTSVGFGNIAPLTNYEKVFSIFAMMLGSLMSAAIFGNVASIMLRLYQGTEEYHEKTTSVKEFIKFHRIPKPLSLRLIESCQQTWWQTSGVDMTGVLKSFPEGLQADICLHLNKTLLSKCSAFQNATPGCLRAVSLKLKSVHVPPGDAIFHRGDSMPAIYFVGQGTIEISREDIVVAILGKHDIFGEDIQHAMTDTRPGYSRSGYLVRAVSYCEVHRIMVAELMEILGLYSEFASDFLRKFHVTFSLRMPGDVSRDTSKLRLSKTSSQEPVKVPIPEEPSEDEEEEEDRQGEGDRRSIIDGDEIDVRRATSDLKVDAICASGVVGDGSTSPEEDTTSGETTSKVTTAGLIWDNSDMEAGQSSVQSGTIVEARGCNISWADDDTLVASPSSDVQSFRVNFDYETFERPEPTTPSTPNEETSYLSIESRLDDLNRRMYNFDRQLTSAVEAILDLLG